MLTAYSHSPTNVADTKKRRQHLSATSGRIVGRWSTNHCKRHTGQPRPSAFCLLRLFWLICRRQKCLSATLVGDKCRCDFCWISGWLRRSSCDRAMRSVCTVSTSLCREPRRRTTEKPRRTKCASACSPTTRLSRISPTVASGARSTNVPTRMVTCATWRRRTRCGRRSSTRAPAVVRVPARKCFIMWTRRDVWAAMPENTCSSGIPSYSRWSTCRTGVLPKSALRLPVRRLRLISKHLSHVAVSAQPRFSLQLT